MTSWEAIYLYFFLIKYPSATSESNKHIATNWCNCAIHSKRPQVPGIIPTLDNTAAIPSKICRMVNVSGSHLNCRYNLLPVILNNR